MNQTEVIETINSMSNAQQIAFYNGLRAKGISESDIRTIQAVAFYTKLFTDPAAYFAVRSQMGDALYQEFTTTK